jgi:hypothetical protein
MNISPLTLLVAAVFAAQILVMSVFVPHQVATVSRRIRERYPRQTHPRLYPLPEGYGRMSNFIVAALRVVIAVGATGVLILDLVKGGGPFPLAPHMVYCGIVQAIPALLSLPRARRVMRAIRAAPAPAVRSVEFAPRRLTQFVPPALIVLSPLGALAGAVTAVEVYRLGAPRTHWSAALEGVVCVYLLGYMLTVMVRPLALPRPDPFISETDLFRHRRRRLRGAFGYCGIVGILIAVVELDVLGVLTFNPIYIFIGTSVFFQALYLYFGHSAVRALAERDLSVYQAESA